MWQGNEMGLLRLILLLPFAATLALGEPARQSKPANLPRQPEALVRSLYTEAVARHPVGIPGDADMKIFAPYLSRALLHGFDVAVACAADYDRQYPDLNLKPPFAWLEAGLFSGANERSQPRTFQIERTQSEMDGSLRVYVRLTWREPHDKLPTVIWHVAAIVVRENGHYVVDDVVYLKDKDLDVESRLSEYLSYGCDGPRWVGHGDQPW
jgi:hypothetical protein